MVAGKLMTTFARSLWPIGCVFTGALIAGVANGYYAWRAEADATASIQLSRHEVRPGEAVKLHQYFTLPEGYAVVQASFEAEMLAFYDRNRKSNIFLDDTFGRQVAPGFLEEIPVSLHSPHGMALTRNDDGRFTRTQALRPQVPGIYLITAKYALSDGKGNSRALPANNSTILLVGPGKTSVSVLAEKRWNELEQSSKRVGRNSEDGLP